VRNRFTTFDSHFKVVGTSQVHHDEYVSVQTITGAEIFSTASVAMGNFQFPYAPKLSTVQRVMYGEMTALEYVLANKPHLMSMCNVVLGRNTYDPAPLVLPRKDMKTMAKIFKRLSSLETVVFSNSMRTII